MAQAALETRPGDNGYELTEAEKRSLLVNGLAEIEKHAEEKDRFVALIRTTRKKLVANGFKPKVIDFALRLRKTEDAEVIEQRRAEMEVARFLNHALGTQPDMFDQPDGTPEAEKAENLGEIAGAEGKTCSAPYVLGSPNEQAWITGWHRGQETISSAFKKLEAKAEAESEDDSNDSED